jgi:hypothetical protein
MEIEQTLEQFEASRQISAHLHFQEVRLVSCRAIDLRRDKSPKSSIKTDIKTKRGKLELRGGTVCMPVDLSFKMSDPDPSEVWLEIECTLEAEYTFKLGLEPTQMQLESFHSANAIFNCWPFFREIVASICQRMHIPVLLMPLLRLVIKQKQEEQAVIHEKPRTRTAKG